MTRPAAPRKKPGQATIPAARVEVLDAGRAAPVRRRRADRDLKAEAETVRAHLAQDGPRAAAAATARKEAALEIENRMLLEQNAALQRTLHEVQNKLRTLRARELGARLRDGLNARSMRDTEMEELREQRDAALAASRQAETAMQALRNVNQRLMVENSRLIAAAAPGPAQTASATSKPPGP